MRTPETLSLAERAARLQAESSTADASFPEESAPTFPTPVSLGEQRRSLAHPLTTSPDAAGPAGEQVEILPISEIDCYDGNPRIAENPRYDPIKESMQADGITNMFSVTRRPGQMHYVVYGGGNTRLRIAKELYAAGDQRFSHLAVRVRSWTSELNILASHLSENDNRGDTSFWEKSRGVAQFVKELEKAQGKQSLTASDIHLRLKSLGMNFGVRNIQNFLFATQYLTPVGPWLKSRAVNQRIRPHLNLLLELGRQLGKKAETLFALKEALERQGEDIQLTLKTRRGAAPDTDDCEIDVDALLQAITAAFAQVLELRVDRMMRMAHALAANPRLNASGLLALDDAPEPPSPSLPEDGVAAPPLATARPALPLPARRSAHSGLRAPLAHARARMQLLLEVRALMAAIDEVVPVSDFVLLVDALPFGFMVDIPEACYAGDAAQSDQRKMLWQLLAALSGQLHETYWRQAELEMEDTRWATEQRLGLMAFAQRLTADVGVGSGPVNEAQTMFDMYVSAFALWTLFSHAQLSPLILRLLGLREALYQITPAADRGALCLAFAAGSTSFAEGAAHDHLYPQ
jgi:ParB family protein of integrating conjugative element (PFGI_1 class)